MSVSIVVAVAENGVIGKDNDLPWSKLPADLRWFRERTMGRTVIMGRRTWESIGCRALPGRRNIVVTRNPGYEAAGATVVSSFEAALSTSPFDEEVCVLGGSEIFRLALPVANRIYLTRVHATLDGDTRFPDFDTTEFDETTRIEHPADERNAHDLTFLILDRKGAA